MDDLFWAMANELSLDTSAPFESTDEDEDHTYQTLFWDQGEGEGIVINPRSILRMCIKKAEAVSVDPQLQSKAQSHQYYDAWV